MTTATPQDIEIRVNERIWSFFFTSEATDVNVSWNLQNFEFYLWPCPCEISPQTIFLNAAAWPIPPANISQQTDGRKLKSIRPISRNLQKRHANARKPG